MFRTYALNPVPPPITRSSMLHCAENVKVTFVGALLLRTHLTISKSTPPCDAFARDGAPSGLPLASFLSSSISFLSSSISFLSSSFSFRNLSTSSAFCARAAGVDRKTSAVSAPVITTFCIGHLLQSRTLTGAAPPVKHLPGRPLVFPSPPEAAEGRRLPSAGGEAMIGGGPGQERPRHGGHGEEVASAGAAGGRGGAAGAVR